MNFEIFLLDILNNHSNILENISNYTFICDNCKVHHSRCLKDFINKHFDIMYLSVYSPFLNPIEELYSLWK